MDIGIDTEKLKGYLMTLYGKDFCKWLEEQAAFILNKEFDKLDIENLADEIESIISTEKQALGRYLRELILNLFREKYNQVPKGEIYRDRLFHCEHMIYHALRDSPSLHEWKPKALYYAYEGAKFQFIDENEMYESNEIPENCPWTVDELISHANWLYEENADDGK